MSDTIDVLVAQGRCVKRGGQTLSPGTPLALSISEFQAAPAGLYQRPEEIRDRAAEQRQAEADKYAQYQADKAARQEAVRLQREQAAERALADLEQQKLQAQAAQARARRKGAG